MIDLYIYCAFCVLLQLGICFEQKKFIVLNVLFAPIMTPFMVGAYWSSIRTNK